MSLEEFISITLCNVIYKLISNLLMSRLSPYLDKIGSPFQSSFIMGHIKDNVIVL